MKTTHFKKITARERYKEMALIVVPRPIAWIVTENRGVVNVAPFSYFTPVSSEPPLLMVSIGKNKKTLDEPKDTYKNLLETKKCTICNVDASFVKQMDESSTEFPSNQSEIEVLDLSTDSLIEGYPPFIKGVKTAMFCTLHSVYEIDGSKTVSFFLEIDTLITTESTADSIGRGVSGYVKWEALDE